MHCPLPVCEPEVTTALSPTSAADAYARWKSWDGQDFGQPTRRASAYFNLLWRRFIHQRHGALRVLEIGFGNGQFLGWCRQQGLTVRGIETNDLLIARAQEAGFDCAHSLADLGHLSDRGDLDAACFDVIVLFDVLEHLPTDAITDFLRELAIRLAKNGRIILRTPNGGSPFGLNHQHGDPTHVTVLTANKLKFLSAPAGLKACYCGEDLRPLRGMPLRTWPASLLRRVLHRLLERLVRFAFAPQPRGVLSANLLTVLRHAEQDSRLDIADDQAPVA